MGITRLSDEYEAAIYETISEQVEDDLEIGFEVTPQLVPVQGQNGQQGVAQGWVIILVAPDGAGSRIMEVMNIAEPVMHTAGIPPIVERMIKKIMLKRKNAAHLSKQNGAITPSGLIVPGQ